MEDLVKIPSDLLLFLEAREPLVYDVEACECGDVTLVSPEELILYRIKVRVDEHQQSEPGYNYPDGYFIVPMINLIADCEHYSPDFILSWLPVEETYATYNSTHELVEYFPSADWADIVKDPEKYLSAQWRDVGISRKYTPKDIYEFVDDNHSSKHMFVDD